MKEERAARDSKHPSSSLSLSRESHRSVENPVSQDSVHKIVKELMQEAINKVEDFVMNIAEQAEFGALETCDVDRNKAFIKDALSRAFNRLLFFILNCSSCIKESIKGFKIQVATALKT